MKERKHCLVCGRRLAFSSDLQAYYCLDAHSEEEYIKYQKVRK